MSATFVDSVLPRGEHPRDWPVRTADLGTPATTDVRDENTADLQDDPEQARARAVEPTTTGLPAEATTPGPDSLAAKAARVVIAPGAILCDRFIVEKAIGQGGTAIVYRARDIHRVDAVGSKAQIAIKTPLPTAADPVRAVTRLKHEFERARVLSHPNIVRVLDLHCAESTAGDAWFMTMELIEGKLLSTLLKERTSTPVSLAHKVLRACGDALSHAHSRQVVHGDFKPGNIFVTPDANVKIVDFGAAASSPDDPSRIPAATPAYASPEVLSGKTPESRDDVFSFACVAYELLTGQHPFDHKSSLEARDAGYMPQRAWNLSASQWLALLSALSWQREQRPASIESLMSKLTSDFSDIAVPELSMLDAPEMDAPVHVLPADILPPNRSWGFIAFAAALAGVAFLAVQHNNEPELANQPQVSVPNFTAPAAGSTFAARPLPLNSGEEAGTLGAPSSITDAPAEPPVEEAPAIAEPVKSKPAAAGKSSTISFETSAVVTSETSIAAVFVVKRSPPLTGRAVVQWQAEPGTAELHEDFLIGSGTVELPAGQATRAIYIPLRNDQIKEEDETFTLVLSAPHGAKLASEARAIATIRDDD